MEYKHIAVWPETHAEIKRKASERQQSMAQYVAELVRDDEDWLQSDDCELSDDEKSLLRSFDAGMRSTITVRKRYVYLLDILQERMGYTNKSDLLEVLIYETVKRWFNKD